MNISVIPIQIIKTVIAITNNALRFVPKNGITFVNFKLPIKYPVKLPSPKIIYFC